MASSPDRSGEKPAARGCRHSHGPGMIVVVGAASATDAFRSISLQPVLGPGVDSFRMATVEVHDGQGRVQFVELAQDHPSLFGTSAACDIVLAGEGISPVHGRIRWKKGKYRVEASPDAQYVTDQRPQDDVFQSPSGRRDDRRPLPFVHDAHGRIARNPSRPAPGEASG